MLKKSQITFFCAAIFLFFCAATPALASYDRSPAGSSITSPVSFDWGSITCAQSAWSMAIAPNTGGITGWYILPLQSKTNPVAVLSCGQELLNADTGLTFNLPCPFETVGDTQIVAGCYNGTIGSFVDWTGEMGNPIDEVDGDIFTMSEEEPPTPPTEEMSATSTLYNIGSSVITTSMTFFQTLVIEYWPYILVFFWVIFLLKVFGKYVNPKNWGQK